MPGAGVLHVLPAGQPRMTGAVSLTSLPGGCSCGAIRHVVTRPWLTGNAETGFVADQCLRAMD